MSVRTLFIAIAALLIASCSEFSKAVKSSDVGYKYQMAVKYYDQADYDRAMPLLEELRTLTRGDTLFEPVSYYHAKGYFGMRDYIMASYYLENFAKTFPNSVHAEEATFLAAYCHYKESPEYELDQTDTKTALDKMELFMVRYPETTLKDSCNALIDELRHKLEMKDHAAAQQYLRTRHYGPASLALQDFLTKWPNSVYREEVLFSIFKAEHDLALNSVDIKKEERTDDGIRSFNTFADAFPQSTLMGQARTMLNDLMTIKQRSQRQSSP